MKTLRQLLVDYLILRRALGFKLRDTQSVLERFVTFLEGNGFTFITIQQAVSWATQPKHVQPAHWASRLSMIRLFAEYVSGIDSRTEIPSAGLLPYRYQRSTPYIYSDAQIVKLIKAAHQLPSATGLRAQTYASLFGLLAVTGMRISEAIALNCDEVNLCQGLVTIRETKCSKTRWIPVHASTRNELRKYAEERDQLFLNPLTPSFFVAERGTRLTDCMVRVTFVKLSRQIGLRGASDSHGPRLHDLRHTFAVKTLIRWYQDGLNIDANMPLLSTYLGHTHVTDTYWYISGVPELFRLATMRLDRFLGELP